MSVIKATDTTSAHSAHRISPLQSSSPPSQSLHNAAVLLPVERWDSDLKIVDDRLLEYLLTLYCMETSLTPTQKRCGTTHGDSEGRLCV